MFLLDHLSEIMSEVIVHLGTFIDIHYTQWLVWLFTPICIVILFPATVLLLLYMSSLIVYIIKLHKKRLLNYNDQDLWETSRTVIGVIWAAHSTFWHGYEVRGLKNIPEKGGALLIYYHGALPMDCYYLVSQCWLQMRRLIHAVGDRFLFKIPGWTILWETFGVTAGTVQSCVSQLKNGDLLVIAPGGVYEAQMGDHNYEILWKQRVGFAKVALDAQVPVIPVFTRNIREAFRAFNVCRPFWQWLYHKTRLPLVPVYGGFPVKLVTYVGEPIAPEPDDTPEILAARVAKHLENLINKHQKKPGNILRALSERFYGVDNN